MKHPDGRKIIFPYHDEVDRYTLKGSLKDAEIDLKDFIATLSKKFFFYNKKFNIFRKSP